MLDEYLLDTDDAHCVLLCKSMLLLKKINFIDLLPELIESIKNSGFNIFDDGENYEISFEKLTNNTISVTIKPHRLKSDSVVLCFNNKRLLNIECFVLDSSGDLIPWAGLCTRKMIIYDNGETMDLLEIEENIFQYDVVSPLARLLLEFTKGV